MRHAGMVCAAAVLLLLLLDLCQGCSCPVRHPQQHFCEADFVANVKVRRTVTLPDGQTVLRVRVRRMLKGSPKAVMALSSGIIYTVPGTCSVNVTQRAMHVVTGEVQAGKPWTSACHFTAPWPSLAPKMKKGFRLLYSTACDCPIMSCHWWERSCPTSPFFCPWKTSTHSEDCQARHSVCLRSPSGGCRWVGGRLLRGCMKRWRSGLVRAGAAGTAGTAGTTDTAGTGRTEWRNVASLVPESADVATAPEDAHDPIISNDVVDDLPSHRGGGVWVNQPRPQSPRYDKPRKFDPRRPYVRHHKPSKPVKPSHFGETPLQLGEKPSQLGEILLSQTSPKVEMIAAPVAFNSSGGASDHHESQRLHPVVHGHDATALNQPLAGHATSGSQSLMRTHSHSRLSSDPATRSRLSGVRPPKSSDLENPNEEVTDVPPEPYLRLLRYPEYTTQIGTFDHD